MEFRVYPLGCQLEGRHHQELRIAVTTRGPEVAKSVRAARPALLRRFARRVNAGGASWNAWFGTAAEPKEKMSPTTQWAKVRVQIVEVCGAGESGARIRGGSFDTDTRSWRATSMPLR